MNEEKRRELEGGVNFDVEPGNGTRYDFVAINDPNGGILICWPIMGYMYRYFARKQSEIKQLGRDGCRNEHDMKAIKQIMDNWFNGVKQ